MLDYKDLSSGKHRSKKIAGAAATLAQIWQAVEANQSERQSITTFKILSVDFQQSIDWKRLSNSTKDDYLGCHKKIINTKTGEQLLGDIDVSKWSVGVVRKYRDFRGEESASRANKELGYISRVFGWAYCYEKVSFNPAKGVPKLPIKSRKHYADDYDYQFLLQVAKESNYWYMPIAMEIAYLCRMRLSEVIDMTDYNALQEGLLIKRRKGSRDNIVEWYPHLAQLWQTAIKTRDQILTDRHQPQSADKFVFISDRTGDRIQRSSLKTAKNRIDKQAIKKAEELGITYVHFTFHDLKRKGVTDTKGNKQEASGHRNASMLNIYDVKPIVVKAAGEK